MISHRAYASLLLVSASVAGVTAMQDFQTRPSPRRIPALVYALTRYSEGDAGAARAFAFQQNKASAVRGFQEQARRWIQEDGQASHSRRITTATFVLDVVRHWTGGQDWQYARPLLAWGCTEMTASGVSASAERVWHLAAVAVAQGAEDWTLLVGRRPPSGRPFPTVRNPVENEMRQGHLSHALARLSDEPRLAMASAVAAENRTWDAGGFGRDLNLRGGLIVGEIDGAYLDRLRTGDIVAEDGSKRPIPGAKSLIRHHLMRIDELRQVRAQFLELTARPSLAAEAHVRLALVMFRLAEQDEALRHLARARELAREPFVVYLAHLFTGAIRERQGRDVEAIDAYRAALTGFPRAQSATSLLASRLFNLGNQAEAAALVNDFFTAPDPAPDPWRLYRLGDMRLLPTYLEQLRAEISR